MTRHGGEIRNLASRLAGALLDAGCRGDGRGFAARLVVGGEEGGELVRLGACESITMTGIPASVTLAIGSPNASKMVGDMTTAVGFEAAALSSTAISPAASSFGVPSFSTLTPSNLPASSAPLKTHCQYSDVVAFTMTATVSSAWLV